METARSVRVAVVGAGLEGLAAASRFVQQGCEVILLEESQHVGGRFAGESVEGFCVEATPPLVTSMDHNLLDWIESEGLSDVLLPPRPAQLAQIHAGEPHLIDTASLGGLAALPGVGLRDRWRLLRLARLMDRYRPHLDPDHPERAAHLDYRSAADFGRLYFGQSIWDHWISPATTSRFVSDDEELSRVSFLLARVAHDEGRAILGVPRRGLHELTIRVASRIGVHLGARVDAIEELDGGGYSLDCGVEGVEGETRTLQADAVVIATAPDVAARIGGELLTLGERDFFAQVKMGPLVTLSIALDTAPPGGARMMRVPRVENSPIESYLIEAGTQQGRAPHGRGRVTLIANSEFARANESATDEVVEKTLLSAFGRLHRNEARSVRFSRLVRRPSAMPLFHVGAYRALDRFVRIQVDRAEAGRRISFAGDYLMGPTAENAVASGLRAADLLLDQWDSRRS